MTTTLRVSCISSRSQVWPHLYSMVSSILSSRHCSCSAFFSEWGHEYQYVITNLSSPPLTAASPPIEQLYWTPREDWNLWRSMYLTVSPMSWPSIAPKSLKVHKGWVSQRLKVHSGPLSRNPLPSKSRYKRSLGCQCKTIHHQYLFSKLSTQSQLYITFNTGLQRFIVWPWLTQSPKPGPESHQPPGP